MRVRCTWLIEPSINTMGQTSVGNYRWTICGLMFFATTINYMDRQVIALLKPYLESEFKWNSGDYANIEIAFKICYALGMLGVGRVIDKLGTKVGYGVFAGLWSIAAVLHAAVTSTLGFIFARSFLGVTEAGNFPAAIKTTAEWFPRKERAFATGIFNSGSNIGAIIAPLSVPFIAETYGWQMAFIITGAIGFVWLVLWFMIYQPPALHKKLSKAEFDYIHSDADDLVAVAVNTKEPRITWRQLLTYKQTWAFVIGKFLTDPIWWFYLFWLPDFLNKQYGLTPTQVAIPVALVYVMSSIGSVGGGWLPLQLIKNNWPVFKARKTSMLIYALLILPIIFTQYLGSINMWYAVLLIGLAAAAHQAWSANIFTTVSDVFPKKAVASVTGIGGMAGGIGSVLLSLLVQKRMFVYYEQLHQLSKAYYIMFFICSLAYVNAWAVMFLMIRSSKPIKL